MSEGLGPCVDLAGGPVWSLTRFNGFAMTMQKHLLMRKFALFYPKLKERHCLKALDRSMLGSDGEVVIQSREGILGNIDSSNSTGE